MAYNYTDMEQLVKIRLAEHPGILKEIHFCMASGATGGEINGCVASFLNGLRRSESPLYQVLLPEADEYLSQFHLHG